MTSPKIELWNHRAAGALAGRFPRGIASCDDMTEAARIIMLMYASRERPPAHESLEAAYLAAAVELLEEWPLLGGDVASEIMDLVRRHVGPAVDRMKL